MYLFIFLVLVIAAMAVAKTVGVYNEAHEITSMHDTVIKQQKERLTEWVYQRSEKISKKVAREIVDTSQQYKNALLLLAIFETESNFVPSAISGKGAKGLGQIHWPSHKKTLTETGICKQERDLFDLETNVRASHLLLVDMLNRSNGDVIKALRLYLGGHDGAYTMRILNNYVQLSMLTST
jgi:soluble lytic murein transglycosylase-like protein